MSLLCEWEELFGAIIDNVIVTCDNWLCDDTPTLDVSRVSRLFDQYIMRVQRTLWFLGLIGVVLADDTELTTCINDGCLKGTREFSRLGYEFAAFRGIPYAKPPIDELRFKPPVKPDIWDVRNATKDEKICPQVIFHQREDLESSEDCLYLNVYTPQMVQVGLGNVLMPVIVIFHPGNFQYWSGTSNHFPPNYLLDSNVIVVSANYRLNIFGFLSTEDDASPGNYGLKDQNFVLQWVQENVIHFGGDPRNVTIQGQGAGGASVHFHMLSPLSEGLFHRAIAQSGSALAPWAMSLPGEAREHAEYLAKFLKCPLENSTTIVNCLRTKSTEELLDTDPIFYIWHIDPIIPWKPSVEPEHEGAFLTERPLKLLQDGHFADVPFMTGVTSHEGLFRAATFLSHDHVLKNFDALPIKSYPSVLNFYHLPVEEVKEIIMKIMKFYMKSEDLANVSQKSLIDMISDRYFNHPMFQSIELQRRHQKSPIFAYVFNHKPESSSFAEYFAMTNGSEKVFKGVSHGDDLFYLHPLKKTFFQKYEPNDLENAMINRTVDLWTKFAMHGNPTPEGYDISWEAITKESEKIQVLKIERADKLKMFDLVGESRIKFWESLNLEREIPADADFLHHDEL